MHKAIAARVQGDDYQARWFWIQACRMFEDRTKVARVAFEHDSVKAFDDVVTFYGGGMVDQDGVQLAADHYQVKFHVTAAGAMTWKGMMDPDFINAAASSILQRLSNASRHCSPNGTGRRFTLYAPWTVHPDDPLAQLVSFTDGRLTWDRLAVGGPRSQMGKIRAAWRSHLGLGTDEELRLILHPLRIEYGPTLAELGRRLNASLRQAGLLPVEDSVRINPYDDLIRKLLCSARIEFTRDDIVEVCKRENLWVGQRACEPNAYRIGIRSFLRWAEHLEDQADRVLCLLRHFDGRKIKDPRFWQTHILPEVSAFIADALRGRDQCQVHLHAHTTIAFLTGYCLDTKSGVDVAPVQATSSGREVWRPDARASAGVYPELTFEEHPLSQEGVDVALALSVTTNVLDDVKAYVARALPGVRRVIQCTLQSGLGNAAIVSGTHARLLAQSIASHVKTGRSAAERGGRLHIFAAAPNGLVFFLGQVGRGFGPCVLYEYDFESNAIGAYEPSITLPIAG